MQAFKLFIVLLHLALLSISSFAYDKASETVTLASKVLKEERDVTVHLPPSYGQSPRKSYPVLYLLDGPGHIGYAKGIIETAARRELTSEVIIVEIPNTNRTRDFTPTRAEGQAESGGADNFIRFIETELMPQIHTSYRTNKFNIIVGHSWGGLLVLRSLTTKPNLFQAHIAFSPSLSWDNKVMVKNVKAFIDSQNNYKNYLYMNMGNEGQSGLIPGTIATRDGFIELDQFLKNNKPAGFRYKSEHLLEETHGSTPLAGLYPSLRGVYEGWNVPFKTVNLGVNAIEKHFADLSERLGIEIQPSESVVNNAGYFHIWVTKDTNKALAFFKHNIESHPNSANAYDSYAEALAMSGKVEQAIKQMQTALSLVEKGSSEYDYYQNNLAKLKEKQLREVDGE